MIILENIHKAYRKHITNVLNNITNMAIGCFFLDIIIEKSLNVLMILKFSKNPI